MKGRRAALGLAVVALVALLLGLVSGVDAAGAQTVPCKPGVYNCPPDGGEKPNPTTPTPPTGDQGPSRGSLPSTGATIGFLLGLALVLLATGRALVWMARRRRRHRAARRLAFRDGRGIRQDSALPGIWTLAG